MKPTPTDIALIAAALAKNDGSKPLDNIPAAQALWSNAALHLTERTGRARFLAAFKIGKATTLNDFLKMKMPRINTASLRQTRFHQFLVSDYLPKQPKDKTFEGSVETLATFFIKEAKKSGVSANAYPGLSEWYNEKVSSSKAANAKKMHEKRESSSLVSHK